MRLLAQQGVITRKTKAGTVVVDPCAFTEPIWRVGVAENFTSEQRAAPFQSQLAALLQRELILAGASPRLYLRERVTEPIEPVTDYPQLALAADQGYLDGAIATGNIDPSSWREVAGATPFCGVGELAQCGAVEDHAGMTRDAVKLLHARGCRKLAVLSDGLGPGLTRFLDGFREGLEVSGLPQQAGELMGTHWDHPSNMRATTEHVIAGQRTAQNLLVRPAGLRPDGLVVMDEYTALGVAAEFRGSSTYRPRIAVLTHLQNPQVYALPVLRFEFDIAELARRCVAVMMERLRMPSCPERVDWVPFCAFVDEDSVVPTGASAEVFGGSARIPASD